MASAQSIEAGNAFVRLWANSADLKKGLDDGVARMANFGNALKTLGSAMALTFAVNKVNGWIESFAEGGRELYLTARQMQMNTNELQEMKKAGEELGIEFESMQMAVNKVRNYVAELATSGQQTNDTMRELGLTLSDVANLSDLDRIQLFGERIRALGNKEMTARIGRQVFGRGGIGIAAAAGDLGGARERARGGNMLSPEQIRQAFDLSQAMRMFDKAVSSVGKTVGAVLAPGFTAVYNTITPIVKAVRNWVTLNGPLIQKVALIGGIVVGISTALVAAATGVSLIGFAWGGVAAVLVGVKAVILAIAGIVAFAFSPLAIITGILVAVGAQLLSVKGGFEAIHRAAERLGVVFGQAFEGIRDAIEGGEIELAWAVAVAGMKVVWIDFQIFFRNTFNTSLNSIFTRMQTGWITAMAFMKRGWIGASQFVADAWNALHESATQDLIVREQGRIDSGQVAPDVGRANIAQMRRAQDIETAGGLEAFEARRRQFAQIQTDADAAIAAIANAPGENLSGDAMNAQIQLENAREAASIAAGAAAARRNADLSIPQRGLEEFASQKDSTRSTFNRDVLWGFGPSPVTRLIDNTQRMIELLIPLRRLEPIEENLRRVMPMEVS